MSLDYVKFNNKSDEDATLKISGNGTLRTNQIDINGTLEIDGPSVNVLMDKRSNDSYDALFASGNISCLSGSVIIQSSIEGGTGIKLEETGYLTIDTNCEFFSAANDYAMYIFSDTTSERFVCGEKITGSKDVVPYTNKDSLTSEASYKFDGV